VNVVLNPQGKEGPASPKSQFKKADGSGAAYALVFGPQEMEAGQLAVKDLRTGTPQRLESLKDITAWAPSLRKQS
jgi:histidyl-tRNA synthetase